MSVLESLGLLAESAAKRVAFRTPGLRRLAAPSYGFGLEPAQLAWLVGALEETRELSGAVVEIGVARGMTTVFMNEALTRMSDPRTYVCVDTFAGFTNRDVRHEQTQRGKRGVRFPEYSYNDPKVFAQNIARLGYKGVRCIASDVAALTAEDVGPISVAIIDVDLYLPSFAALKLVWACLQPGGRVLVDDVKQGTKWDGALQAMQEFATETGVEWRLIGTKGGVFLKGAPDA